MSIYGSVVFNESYNDKPVITDTIESIMEDDSIVLKDENEDFVTEGLEAVAVMSENYSNFMQRVGVSELSAIYATGEEMIYTENVVTDFLGGIKKFLMKIWEKIKSLFKRFIMVIESYTKNDKAFINKYRQQIYRHKSLSDFTFKGYKYHIVESEIEAAFRVMENATKAYINSRGSSAETFKYDEDNYGANDTAWDQSSASKYDEKHDDRMEDLRGEIIHTINNGKKGKYTAEEYRKELDELFRNGESEKQDLDEKDIDVDDMVTEVQNAKQTKKDYTTAFKASKRAIDSDFKTVDRWQKEHIKDNMPSKNNDTDTEEEYNNQSGDVLLAAINSKLGKSYANLSEVITALGSTGTSDDGEIAARQKLGLDANDDVSNATKLTGELKAKKFKIGTKTFDRSNSKRRAAQLNDAIKVINATKGMLVTFDSCVLKALKDRNRQYKACLVKIAYHNPKNESSFTESYDHSSYNNYNFISNIQFK